MILCLGETGKELVTWNTILVDNPFWPLYLFTKAWISTDWQLETQSSLLNIGAFKVAEGISYAVLVSLKQSTNKSDTGS